MKLVIEALGTSGKEEILQYLEEVFVLGSFATEVTNEVKENRFSGGKSALIVEIMKYPEMESIMQSKDISVNPVERLLLISHSLQSIIARKMLSNGYNMPSA